MPRLDLSFNEMIEKITAGGLCRPKGENWYPHVLLDISSIAKEYLEKENIHLKFLSQISWLLLV